MDLGTTTIKLGKSNTPSLECGFVLLVFCETIPEVVMVPDRNDSRGIAVVNHDVIVHSGSLDYLCELVFRT